MLTDTALKWLERYCISKETAEHFNLTVEEHHFPELECDRKAIRIPYVVNGTVVGSRWVDHKENWTSDLQAPHLWNIDAKKPPTLYVCDNELAVMALHGAGIPAVCPSDYGKPDEFAEVKYLHDVIAGFTEACLLFSKTQESLTWERSLSHVFASTKATTTRFHDGCQTVFQVLKQHGQKGITEIIGSRTGLPPHGIKSFSDYSNDIFDYYHGKKIKYYSTGFSTIDKFWKMQPGALHILTGIPMSGKALDVHTLVPTVAGFKKMLDVHPGDILFDENGKQCTVLWESNVQSDRTCYEITFSNHETVVADAEHRWFTSDHRARVSHHNSMAKLNSRSLLSVNGVNQTWKKTYPSVKSTETIAQSLKVEHGKRHNHLVRVAGAVDTQHNSSLPVPPYVLGAWLGDGNSINSGITTGDVEIIEEIKKHFSVTVLSPKYHYYIRGLIQSLRACGVIRKSKELPLKHIPDIYMQASISQRQALLCGLMDTDGTINKNGNCSFAVTNQCLARGAASLVSSLGMRASFNHKTKKYKGQPYAVYEVSFSPNFPCFLIKRKIARYKERGIRTQNYCIVDVKPTPSRPVKCIAVDSPSHQFLITKSFIPTHNSEILDQIMINTIGLYDFTWLVFSPENSPPYIHAQKLIEKALQKPMFGKDRMTEKEMMLATAKISQHIKFIPPEEDDITLDYLLSLAKLACSKWNINGVVLDPYNEITHCRENDEKETDYIGRFLAKYRNFARMNGLIAFLVSHPTKLQKDPNTGEYEVPTMYSISGSANFRNKADVGLAVWRKFQEPTNEVSLFVQKMRNKMAGSVGEVKLYWNWKNGTFEESQLPLPSSSDYQIPD